MAATNYQQFCPISLAAEIFCTRWTALILRDLLKGSTRFNELQRGVPRISSALLTKRLREMEAFGLIEREGRVNPTYRLTEAGAELAPAVYALGRWGVKWIDPELSLDRLDVQLLMWLMSRDFDPKPAPERRCVIEFDYPELPPKFRHFWLIVEPGATDLCATNPGFEVDLYVSADLKAMAAVWMGLAEVRREIAAGRIELVGSKEAARLFPRWLAASPMAAARREVESQYDMSRVRRLGKFDADRRAAATS
jgi:DNA-binding HxlR family transcriptional regulator